MMWLDEFEQIDFTFEGREASVVLPKEPNGKWLLKTEYFMAFPQLEHYFVSRGYTLAFVKNRDRWAEDADLEAKQRFCLHVIDRFGLKDKCIPVGMSCGGLIAVKFAARYPELVQALYLDAPVINLLSCPCGFGVGTDLAKENVGIMLNALGLNSVSEFLVYRDHPLDRIPDLIVHKIPVALVCGDSDITVPYEENGALVKQAYEATNLPFLFLLKEGVGHHPHGPGAEHEEDFYTFLDNQYTK